MRFGLREIIFIIVLLAVPTVSLFYVFKPRNEDIREALDEIQVKQARLDRLAEATAQIDDLGLAIEEGRELIRKIEEKLPTERDVEGVLTRVWQIAAKNRLAVKSVKSEKPTPAAHYRELPLKVVVEGGFDGFYQFLLELEELPRITRVHQMELERSTARGPVGRSDLPPGAVKASFTLSIYFEPSTDQV